ncbi:hypothetical protein [Acidithiobacillus ferrooxidans]|uniref:hypothetical protein n=2 Tax=Acidithiobacillus ferrooxidans TaxID=920 RepID=UPI0013D79B42|nr:hypothetical protein [Acidithiobacillus ferrooxidans]
MKTKKPITSSPPSKATSENYATVWHASLGGIFPLSADTTDVAHGRFEYRKITVATQATGIDFPYLGQAFLIQRVTIDMKDGALRDDYAFGLTSMTKDRATPENLLGIARGHWEIENRNHHVRDTTYHEDLSQIRTENGPHMMATLRGLAMSIMRLIGVENIAKAGREFAASARKTLRQFGY